MAFGSQALESPSLGVTWHWGQESLGSGAMGSSSLGGSQGLGSHGVTVSWGQNCTQLVVTEFTTIVQGSTQLVHSCRGAKNIFVSANLDFTI